ncbi:MAG: hypothetical protein ACI8QT_000594 [Halioglobus sp.]|jgi:hypothetical protein
MFVSNIEVSSRGMSVDSYLPWQFNLLLGLVFVAVTLGYASGLSGPLFFDDLPSLVQNPMVHIDGAVFDHWRTAAFSSDAGPLHRPVAMLSFAANYAASADLSPFPFKLVNLVIHLLICVLVYYFAQAVFRSPVVSRWDSHGITLAAFAAASIWALHPLHVTTVLYAVQRMAQLSTLFSLLGLCVYMRYRLEWAQNGATVGAVLAAGLWVLLLTGLATLSKENGALLPWLLAVCEVCLFRGKWHGVRSRLVVNLGWVALLLPLLLIVIILFVSPEIFLAGYKWRDYTMVERLLTQSRILWQYVYWLVLPDLGEMGFHHDDIALSRGIIHPWTTLVSLLAWLSVTLVAFWLRRRLPLLLFAVLFFLVGHVMESSVLALELVFEHRNYFPSVGVCLGIGALFGLNATAASRIKRGLTLFVVMVLLFLLLLSRAQTWSEPISLAQTNVRNHPLSPRAHFFYADTLFATVRDPNRWDQGRNDQEEKMRMAVLSRSHFLRMHEERPASAIAIVKLLYVDSFYFPGLAERMNWFGLLRGALEKSTLLASDLSALSLLVDCASFEGCNASVGEVEEVLDSMISRNPGEIWLHLMRYKLMSFSSAPSELRISALQMAVAVAPDNPSAQEYLVREKGAVGDVAGMYEVVRNWLSHDPNRRALPNMLLLFSAQPRAQGQETLNEPPSHE